MFELLHSKYSPNSLNEWIEMKYLLFSKAKVDKLNISGQVIQTFIQDYTVCFLSRSVSMSDMLNEDEVGHLPPLSQSRYERMHEQYNNFLEDEDHWQDVSDVWHLNIQRL